MPGTIVGERYRVLSLLARGGFGAVYAAEQLATERRVALKLLASYLEGISVDQLLLEARITTRLSGDHIVQVLDAGVDAASGAVFVIMELLDGVTLDTLVQDDGPCAPLDAAELLRQVAVGLDKAHGYIDASGQPAAIVHRDLKPENLFLTRRDDGSPLVKILDFGTAKMLSHSPQVSAVIRATPQYMASEQASGEPITPATDVWAFGLIAFYLLTGRSYWLAVEHDGSQAQLFDEILALPLPAASARLRELGAPELGPAFDAWFARCVNRNAAERFGSAGLAARELLRAFRGTPETPRSPAVSSAPPSSLSASMSGAPGTPSGTSFATQDHAALTSTRHFTPAWRPLGIGVALAVAATLGGAATAYLWQQSLPTAANAPGSAGASARAMPASPSVPAPASSSKEAPLERAAPRVETQPPALTSSASPRARSTKPRPAPRAPRPAGAPPNNATRAIDVYDQR